MSGFSTHGMPLRYWWTPEEFGAWLRETDGYTRFKRDTKPIVRVKAGRS